MRLFMADMVARLRSGIAEEDSAALVVVLKPQDGYVFARVMLFASSTR